MNLNQVTVASADVERSMKFYQLLGFKLIVKALPHYVRFETDNGSTFSVSLHEDASGGGTHLYFEVDDVDAKYRELLGRGVEFIDKPEDKSWLWREARFEDPDGNLHILYHAGENRLFPPWRVNEQ